ncbi:MAG: alpha/beta hydrolase [Acidimicrobiia bacterium]|nr:alpha/beta hydrolase [Acidimicrobiia bacterium]
MQPFGLRRDRGVVVVIIAAMAVIAALGVVWQVMHRTSPLVKRWNPSSFPRRTAGPLSLLDSGPTGRSREEVLLLLHGLGATGDYFGAFYDGLSRKRRVVIVDLLGFGHSLDEDRADFGIDAHVAALDDALGSLGLSEAQVVLAAHSMSASVALVWADRHRDRARHVYLWGPPIYPSGAAAKSIGKEYGVMGRLLALDTKWAERACRLNCKNRAVSGRIMALMAPRWPTHVSSRAARHTWDAYEGSLQALILDFKWNGVLPASVPVTVFCGADDPVGDRSHISKLVGKANVVDVAEADHHVALERPELLFDALEASDGEQGSDRR